MPELPEVETMVRGIRPALAGRRIEAASLRHSDILRGVTARRLLRALRGATVDEVWRRAKHGVISFRPPSPWRLVLQPGMTGNLLVYDRPLTPAENRYAVLRLRLDSGMEFVYRDIRRIGILRLLDPAGWAAYHTALGPEPLDPALTPAGFAERLRTSRQAVKKALMDQRRVVGVGNIYANEALFAAGVDPSRPACRVAPERYALLLEETRRILRAAIAAEGTTLRDYRTGTGEPGNFQFDLAVYGREGEACRRCGTALTATHAIDARITVFCHCCQR